MSCSSYTTIQNTSILEIFISFISLKHKNVSWFLTMGIKVFSFVHFVKNKMEVIYVLSPFSLNCQFQC
jgi:hypothetical protein